MKTSIPAAAPSACIRSRRRLLAATTAADGNPDDIRLLGRPEGLLHQDVHDGLLEAGDHIGDLVGRKGFASFFYHVEQRRLQAAEAEIEAIPYSPGKGNGLPVALLGQAVNDDPAGVADVEELGRLVEGLSRRIVLGLADEGELLEILDAVDVRMAAGNDEGHEGKLGHLPLDEKGGCHVAFEMVHANEGQASAVGDGFGRGKAHEERSDKAGTPRCGDAVDVVQGDACIFQGLEHDSADGLDMLARRDFGNDAAVLAVDLDLRGDDVRKQDAPVPDDSGGRFIARRFYTEN